MEDGYSSGLVGFLLFVVSAWYFISTDVYEWVGFSICGLVIPPVVLVLLVYSSMQIRYSYWKRKGVKGPRPSMFVGNFGPLVAKTQAIFQVIAKMSEDYRELPYVGGFRFISPMLIINDLDMINNLLIKDFAKFGGRGIPVFENTEPLSGNLFTLDGDRWYDLRKKLTPVFTGSKLRRMFEQIVLCSKSFETYICNEIGRSKTIDCTEPLSRFTMNVIGLCFFGLKLHDLERDDDEFKRIGKKVLQFPKFSTAVKEISPWLFKILRLNTRNKEVEAFFLQVMRDTFTQREKDYKNETKPRENSEQDFIDILISMRNSNSTNTWKFTFESLAAQAIMFFVAGYETSSVTISCALLELAHSPACLAELRREISEVMNKCNGTLTYDIVSKMKYIDMVIQETLRKHSPTGMLMRQALETCTISQGLTIEKGTFIFVPTHAIQHDPKHFQNPEVFDPQRFTDEAKKARHSMIHLPFGAGPKNCIGERLALYIIKVGLITILKNYRVEPSPLTSIPFEIDPSSNFVIKAKHGISIKFIRE